MTFTEGELAYLGGQPLGRLATAQPNGTLQASPVAFYYHATLETIDIGGRGMAASQKFGNVRANGLVAFVVDDIASVRPWRVRCLEIRGRAEAIEDPIDSAARLPGRSSASGQSGSSAGASIRPAAGSADGTSRSSRLQDDSAAIGDESDEQAIPR